MTESIYKEYENKYYNPNDNDKKPGDNDNWKSIQKGFHDIGSTQLETTEGLTLGKGTEDEVSVTAAELAAMKSGEDILPVPFIIANASNGALTIPANGVTSFQVTGILEPARAFYREMRRKYGSDYHFIFQVEMVGSTDIVFNSLAFDVSTSSNSLNNVPAVLTDNIPDLFIRVQNITAENIILNSGAFSYQLFVVPFRTNIVIG